MKKILLALSLVLVAPMTNAKEKDKSEVSEVLVKDVTGKYVYEGVVNVENISKDEMFKRAKNWVQETFKTGDNNIRFDDKEYSIINSPTVIFQNGKKGILDYYGGLISFKLVIQFKDGKYKFHFDNVVWAINNISRVPIVYGDPCLCTGKQYYKDKINSIFAEMASDLENNIKGVKQTTNDNW
ncbi:DUF4468 domain-containing protein [Edaphocola flava]|uniref:DUF4468 domain-containing protein n=1 Tax=Edaphocola flava TaxID=2499629 RepID=UPI00100B8A8E|nr:DUF4468 domain-containing protein [Edaphocola flava]